MGTRVLQIHKRSSYEYKFIQDKFYFSLDGNIYAIADGTTQSFYSEKWAEIITSQFIKTPSFEETALINLLEESAAKFNSIDFPLSSNPAKAALEKRKKQDGATSTFLGLRVIDNQVEYICSGDSNVFHLNLEQIETYPFSTIDELDNNKFFLNTEKILSKDIDNSYFEKEIFKTTSESIILICTDALSRLFLSKPETITEVVKIKSFEDFLSFCISYWDNKLLQEDDITCLIIDNSYPTKPLLITPPDGFTFPKEIEYEFIPTLQDNTQINHLNINEMDSLMSMINNLYNQLSEITKKTKLYLVILVSILFFTTANFIISVTKSSPQIPVNDSKVLELEKSIEEKDSTIEVLSQKIDDLNKQLETQSTNQDKKEVLKEEVDSLIKEKENTNTKLNDSKSKTKKTLPAKMK